MELKSYGQLQVWALNESVEGSGKKVFKSWDVRLENLNVWMDHVLTLRDLFQ